MSQAHDNKILSYVVDFEKESLVLKTEYYCGEIHEVTDIVFEGYFTHHFEDEQKDSIIFDIEKYDVAAFIKDNHDLLIKRKNYNWPIGYKTEKDLLAFLTQNAYSYYIIDSSCGLYGWVLAKNLQIIVATP